MTTIGFIGLGRMGLPMARHIAAAGHELTVFDVSADARDRAEAAGLNVASSVGELAGSAIVCSSLPATAHVEEAYFGPGGLVPALARGTVCADMSTISIAGSRALATQCLQLGVDFVDAPVSGTSIHAEAATLVVMVGGLEPAVERARPALETFASKVERVGDNGAGLQLKLITNRLLTTHLAAIAEAIVSLEITGLSVPQCIELLRSGAVPKLLDYKASPLADRDFSPQFTVDLMRKDLRLAADELASAPLAAAAHEIVEATSDLGLGDADLAAIITVIEQRLTAD
jgi:2-hydroxy-3-oxopropionate reductase